MAANASVVTNTNKMMDSETKIHESKEDLINYIPAPIDKLGPVGRWVRHRLLESILLGTPVLLAVQRRRTPFVTTIMKAAGFLGTETFYAVIVVILTWLVDMRLARLSCILMGIEFYIANFSKNSLCLPRPPCPPVKPLENAYFTWALPSHHAVLGVVIPWYIWFYCFFHYNLSTVGFVCLFLFISSWSFSVMFSRVYLGVHSPADVVVGSLMGCLTLSVWLRIDDDIDRWTALSNQGAFFVPFYGFLLLFLHPKPDLQTRSFQESNSMASVGVGYILSRALTVGSFPQPKAVIESLSHTSASLPFIALVIVLRMVIGTTLVVVAKESMKTITKPIFRALYRFLEFEYAEIQEKEAYFYTGYGKSFRLTPINLPEVKDDTKMDSPSRPWDLDHPVRFVTYIFMGYTGYYLAPWVFQMTGLVL